MECVTNSRQDIGIKETNSVTQFQISLTFISDNRRNAETQKSGMKYRLIPVQEGTEPSIDFKSNTTNWFFYTLLPVDTG